MFDWIRFLDQHQIRYVTSGPNVARGNISVHCPLCGSEDPSEHMSINLRGSGWRCWRRPSEHRGKNPTRLVQLLLGCTYERAQSLVGGSVFVPGDFMDRVSECFSTQQGTAVSKIELPPSIKPLVPRHAANPFFEYLHKRGFSKKWLLNNASFYGLHYATSGPWKGRIVFPIHDREGRLVTWTGRTIYPNVELRYKVCHVTPEKAERDGVPPAIGPQTDYLLWANLLPELEADTIVVCEGPFDALKVNALGARRGIISTCLFTMNISPAQIDLMHELLPKFARRVLLLDQNTLPVALRIASQLSALNVEVKQLPSYVKDPGELNKETIQELFR